MKTLIVFLSGFAFISCCRDGDQKASYEITEIEREFNPYELKDNITFKHSEGGIVEFKVQNIKTEREFTETEHCGENFYAYEELVVTMEGDVGYEMSLAIQPIEFSEQLTLSIANTYFLLSMNSDPDLESLNIDGLTYKNIYSIESGETDPNIIKPSSLLFNKEYGILQFTMTNNETYSITR